MHALPRVLIFALFLAANMGLGLYVTARSVAPRRFASGRARLALGVGALALAALSVLAEVGARRYAPMGGGPWRLLVGPLRVLGVTLMVTTVGLVAVHLAALPAALLHRLARLARRAPPPAPAPGLTRREAVTQALSAGVAGVTASAALYGSLRERHDLQVTDVMVALPDLAPSLDGLTIVQLTDLHVGLFTGARELEHLVERVARLRPDVVVLTGDIIDHNPAHVADGMRLLARLRGRLGTFAILGNHDHFTGAERVRRGMAAVGLPCLVNASARVHTGDPRRGAITLAGVDDVMAPSISYGAAPDLARALRQRAPDSPTVLLAHNPVFFEEAAGRVDLQLSGHTHGGQINVGGVAGRVLPFVAGRYARDGSTLFVSRGVGITGPPVRLAAAPEIVRVALTARRT